MELFERVTKQQEGRWAAFVFPSEIRLFSILRAAALFVSCALRAKESCLSHPNNASIMKLSHYATRLSVANNSLLSSWNWLLSIIAGDSQRFAKRSRQYRTGRKFSFFHISLSHTQSAVKITTIHLPRVWSNAKAHQTILSVTREGRKESTSGFEKLFNDFSLTSLLLQCADVEFRESLTHFKSLFKSFSHELNCSQLETSEKKTNGLEKKDWIYWIQKQTSVHGTSLTNEKVCFSLFCCYCAIIRHFNSWACCVSFW